MREYIDDFVLVYLDDILVFSSTEQEHENHLQTCFLDDLGNISSKPNL